MTTRQSFNRLVLWIWALWLSVVTITNFCDALKSLGVLPSTFTFASGNYGFMKTVTAVHHTPAALVAFMFAGVIAWEIASAVLHWRAALLNTRQSAGLAFLVSTALWGAFLLADEVYVSYDVESTHLRLFIAALVSVLVLSQDERGVEPVTGRAG